MGDGKKKRDDKRETVRQEKKEEGTDGRMDGWGKSIFFWTLKL